MSSSAVVKNKPCTKPCLNEICTVPRDQFHATNGERYNCSKRQKVHDAKVLAGFQSTFSSSARHNIHLVEALSITRTLPSDCQNHWRDLVSAVPYAFLQCSTFVDIISWNRNKPLTLTSPIFFPGALKKICPNVGSHHFVSDLMSHNDISFMSDSPRQSSAGPTTNFGRNLIHRATIPIDRARSVEPA